MEPFLAAESKLEQECRKLAEKQGYYFLKWVSPGRRGVPDRILLGPNQLIVFIEMKAPGEHVSVMQNFWLAMFRKFGFKTAVVWTLEQFIQLLPPSR